MSTFAENLRQYREAVGLTSKDLAAKIGIKYSTYSNYENQGREPNYDTLRKIAAALGVSIDSLLGYQVNKLDHLLNRLGDNFKCVESSTPGMVTLLYWCPLDKESGKGPTKEKEYNKDELTAILESICKRADQITEPTTKGIIEENVLLRVFGEPLHVELHFDTERIIK